MTPNLQRRHYDYVLGPNQDVRLASVASGAVIQEILLTMDDDAPFVLTSRAVRYAQDASMTQFNLVGLKTRWTGPQRDYRQTDFVLESLQMAYYGQGGCPKPIAPSILYPARSVLMLDLINTGPTITNLSFFFRGYKVYPAGTVSAATYPSRMQSETFAYPVYVSALGIAETRLNQIFTVKQDADFVVRGGQGIVGTSGFAEVSVKFKDHQKNPYSNDFVPLDILFGAAPVNNSIPVGASPNLVAPFGTGPGQMGLFYPEIYLPKNTQLLYDLQRNDPTGAAASFTFNLIGGKVFVP